METTNVNEYKSQMKNKSPLPIDQAGKGHQQAFGTHYPLEEKVVQVKNKTIQAYSSSVNLVRNNPIKSVALALGLGVAVGYIMKKR